MTRRKLALVTVVTVVVACTAVLALTLVGGWWVSGVAVLLGVTTAGALGGCHLSYRDHRHRRATLARFHAAVADLPTSPGSR